MLDSYLRSKANRINGCAHGEKFQCGEKISGMKILGGGGNEEKGGTLLEQGDRRRVRMKAVWFSASQSLYEDAQRDLKALGAAKAKLQIHRLNDYGPKRNKTVHHAVLMFCSHVIF